MEYTFSELYEADLKRYGQPIKGWLQKYHYYFRKSQTCTNVCKYYYRFRYLNICKSHCIEIPRTLQVGKGLYIGHPYGITINGQAILGNNINIHKGVTIGQENRGKRKGTPVIGNSVFIGINSTVSGRIVIGDDVLIGPNTHVNCDVPSHSVVVGNPCVITHRDNATEGYVNYIAE